MRRVWTIEMENLLREKYPVLPADEVCQLFPQFTKSAIKSKASAMKLTKKGKLYSWNYEDEQNLKEVYHNTLNSELAVRFNKDESAVSSAAFKLGLKKTAEFMRFHALKTAFKKGHEPENKGKKQIEYMSPEAIERTKKTRFKKGNMPHNTKDGPGEISIRYDKNNTPYQFICIEYGKWLALHTYNWNKVHGKVPKGYCLWFKDGDTMNPDVSNLECITRMENIRRNSGPLHLRDNMVATYIATKSRKVDRGLKAELVNHPELLELKRNQLLLNRAIKAKQDDKV